MKVNIFLVFIFNSILVFSQKEKQSETKNGSISGIIVDAHTKQYLQYVHITCEDEHKNIIAVEVTNEKGVFTIKNLPLKKWQVHIQFIGYKRVSKSVILSQKDKEYDMGTILLFEDEKILDEVIIETEGSTISQKIDRKVINVGKDLTSAGTNAIEMLQNIPTVNVDVLSGNISMRGNDNVRVLIDGKPSNLSTFQLLKQISSSSIKKLN
ncbi:MAG: TonB-dependent receptor plug domain-containing protein [Flavobacteriaceae bacterium]|nr:MAG: TonB-dependent receptor plug domain-containing protein [Flavobacteriaceae bacterium]